MTNTYNIENETLSSILPGSTVGGVISNIGTSAGTYSITGIGSSGNWNGAITAGTSTSYTWASATDNVMVVKNNPASLEIKGNLVINGQDLEERLSIIEKVLQIPERDVKLEKKHPKLKELYDAYIHALGKYRTWDAIKGDDND
jgi:hypothetical protein